MAYTVKMVDSLPQPRENKWRELRLMLDNMLVCLKPIQLTLDKNESIDHARSTVHAWSRANGMIGKVKTTRGEDNNTLYIYII